MANSRWGVVLLLCAGCAAATPSSTPPRNSPDAPEARASHDPLVDSVAVPRGPVWLDELLTYARACAPRSIVADATRFGAQAEVTAARQRSLYNPTVSLSLGSRTQSSDTGLEAEIGISQRLQIAGERRRRMATAERGVEQVERERTATFWEIEVEVRRLYGLVLILDDLSALTEEASSAAHELAEATRKRVEAGEEPPLAAELALARMAMTEAGTAAVRAQHDAMLGRLIATSGWPADHPLQLRDIREDHVALPPDDALVARALDHNRDKAALEAAIERAGAVREQARRQAWPQPSVGASYTREAGVAGNSAAHVMLGTLSLPIPSFARNQGDRARARANQRTAESVLLAFERALAGRVSEASARVRGALGRIDALRKVATTADMRRVTGLRDAYDAGEVGLLELLRALEQTIETRTAILAAEVDYVDALADLELVVVDRIEGRTER